MADQEIWVMDRGSWGSKSITSRKCREFILAELDRGHQEKFSEIKDQRYLGEEDFTVYPDSVLAKEAFLFRAILPDPL